MRLKRQCRDRGSGISPKQLNSQPTRITNAIKQGHHPRLSPIYALAALSAMKTFSKRWRRDRPTSGRMFKIFQARQIRRAGRLNHHRRK